MLVSLYCDPITYINLLENLELQKKKMVSLVRNVTNMRLVKTGTLERPGVHTS